MFWKIIFYIWIFCTLFNIGEIIDGLVRVKREIDISIHTKQSLYEKAWGYFKIMIICALPIFNFFTCMAYLFHPTEFSDNLKIKVEEQIAKEKEN